MRCNIDFPWVGRLETTAVRLATDIMRTGSEGDVGWWRQRLQEQGLDREQIERLIAYYRAAAGFTEPASAAGGAS